MPAVQLGMLLELEKKSMKIEPTYRTFCGKTIYIVSKWKNVLWKASIVIIMNGPIVRSLARSLENCL